MSFNQSPLMKTQMFLPNSSSCCVHELPSLRSCSVSITWLPVKGALRESGRQAQSHWWLLVIGDTSPPLCYPDFLTITLKCASAFSPRRPSVRFPSDLSLWDRPVVWVIPSLPKVETKSSRSSAWDGSICGWASPGMEDSHVWYHIRFLCWQPETSGH